MGNPIVVTDRRLLRNQCIVKAEKLIVHRRPDKQHLQTEQTDVAEVYVKSVRPAADLARAFQNAGLSFHRKTPHREVIWHAGRLLPDVPGPGEFLVNAGQPLLRRRVKLGQ